MAQPSRQGFRSRDIEQIAQATSIGDACILDVVCRFAEALSSKPFDHAALKSLVAPEIFAQWGDFTQAAMIFEDDCGVSSRVRHLKDGAVLVKLLPNVREAFTIEGPQIIEGGHEVVLVKRNGTWKIWDREVKRMRSEMFEGCIMMVFG